jgi:hypothetical protein
VAVASELLTGIKERYRNKGDKKTLTIHKEHRPKADTDRYMFPEKGEAEAWSRKKQHSRSSENDGTCRK